MATGLYDTKIQGLREQQLTARKLREQAASETPQGKMVSGWYVAPSMASGLANALRQGFAAYDEGQARNKADELEKRKEAETNAVMSQLYSNYQPPQQAEQLGLLDKISNFVTGEKPQEQSIQTPADLQVNPNLDQNGRLAAMLRGSMVNPEAFAPMLGLEQHKMTMEQQKELKQAQLAQQKAQLEQQAAYQQQGLDLRREQMQNQQAIQQQMLDLRRDAAANRPQGRNDWEMIKGADGMPTGRYNTATGQFEALQGAPKAQSNLPQGKPTYDSGSDQFVYPPSEQHPAGFVTPSPGKVASAQNFVDISKEMLPSKNAKGEDVAGVIGKTPTGGTFGWRGFVAPVTNKEQSDIFDNNVKRLGTELRSIMRIPGEGALSDKEQAQYNLTMPNRTYDPRVNEKIMSDLVSQVKNKVAPAGMSASIPGLEPQQPVQQPVMPQSSAIEAELKRRGVIK